MLGAMDSTQCPDCGQPATGADCGGFVAYICPQHGEFRVSGRALKAWSEADQMERRRVIQLARPRLKPPLVLLKYFDL